MHLSFEGLRDIQRKERASSELIALDEGFYANHCGQPNNGDKTFAVFKDICEMRMQKIAMLALRATRAGVLDYSNMHESEKAVYDSVVNALSGHGCSIGICQQPKKQTHKKQELHNKSKAIAAIPQFVGSDMKSYGPYEAGQIIELPDKEFSILLKQNLVERC